MSWWVFGIVAVGVIVSRLATRKKQKKARDQSGYWKR